MPVSKSIARRTVLAAAAVSAFPAWHTSAGAPPKDPLRASDLSTLDNGTIQVGVDRSLGGAIVFLATSGSTRNLVNNFDWGRQIQMSYFSGPVPYAVGEKRPPEHWKHLGWNPIQVGDTFGHRSGSQQHRNDGQEIYTKCQPKQWPLENVPAECRFESWLTLEGPAVKVRCRLTNRRSDKTQYRARDQELPALYTNGEFHRLLTYSGNQPFSNGSLTRIPPRRGPGFPWTRWFATENWAALVDDQDFGLGVWQPACQEFLGGFTGEPGSGGTYDVQTGYLAPVRQEILDHNIVHEFSCTLIVGTVAAIRDYVYQNRAETPERFRFQRGREGWRYQNAYDTGWPVAGKLNIQLRQDDPQLVSPRFFWPARSENKIRIRAAFVTREDSAILFWNTPDTKSFPAENHVRFPIRNDGSVRQYEVTLPPINQPLTQLRLDPVSSGGGTQSLQLYEVARVE